MIIFVSYFDYICMMFEWYFGVCMPSALSSSCWATTLCPRRVNRHFFLCKQNIPFFKYNISLFLNTIFLSLNTIYLSLQNIPIFKYNISFSLIQYFSLWIQCIFLLIQHYFISKYVSLPKYNISFFKYNMSSFLNTFAFLNTI